MEKTTIDSLLSSMVALVGDARGSLFGQEKCMVDREQLLYLVDALQTQIPQEISQAKDIIESCNELRTNAKKDAAETRKAADQVLRDAEERAAKLIEEDTIVVFAKKREQEILEEAQHQRDELIAGAISYADSIMEEAEKTVTETYDALNEGIGVLQQQAKADKKTALGQIREARNALKNAAKTEQAGK
jgi:cell division septum initiation protein DivIVA